MKRTIVYLWVLAAAGFGSSITTLAQGLPKTQPKLLTIIREEVKIGRNAEHSKAEAGWPAAFEKAKSTDYYIGLTSMTGPNEAWFIIPAESHAAFGESFKKQDKDPILSAELDRLSLADADYINGARTLQAVARPDLTVGEFPDVSKARFFEVTFFRIHPGHSMQFEEAAKAYAAARKRADEKSGYRVYQVIAGMASPTYLVISSVEDYSQFDQRMAADMGTWQKATDDEKAILEKAGREAIIGEESNRFRVDPRMSFVPKETRDSDKEFWMPK
ncbi:MAG TPA: hypothetical protein VL361_24665 [Candidatus Limnocylindrales bacterium]|nr:hypothetical protein [Candidatus Limnocylindrales bacterium]